jgi:uncharacterized protein
MSIQFRQLTDGIEIRVKAVPGASRSRMAGALGDELKILVAEPPEKGRANAAVEAILAELLGVPRKSVSVVSGLSNPHKTVRILGVTVESARDILGD